MIDPISTLKSERIKNRVISGTWKKRIPKGTVWEVGWMDCGFGIGIYTLRYMD